MKIIKASKVVPDTKGFFCHLTSEEAILIRQLVGDVSPSQSVYPLAHGMRMAMISKENLMYVPVFDGGQMKFRTDAMMNIHNKAKVYDGEDE